MIQEGDRAPRFRLPIARGRAYNDVETFDLAEALGDGPVVLAFFPAAFTSGCTEELRAFTADARAFEDLDAAVYGISVDLSFSHNEFIETEDLDVPLLSDHRREVTRAYGVVYEGMYDHFEVSQRSVFVLDADGVVRHRWVREGDNPDFETFVDDLQDVVREVRETDYLNQGESPAVHGGRESDNCADP
ncbi:MAG: redoxin domain-containing protein [Haloferacaceae archaeon]